MNRMSLPEKLSINKYELDEGHPHIVVTPSVQRRLQDQGCLFVCPAGVYSEQEGKIVADWSGCVECGTCKAACPARPFLGVPARRVRIITVTVKMDSAGILFERGRKRWRILESTR